MTKTDLIAGLRKQSPKAQQETIDRYGREVFAQVVRLVAVTENAEEVYQNVFMKVFSNIGQHDAGRASLSEAPFIFFCYISNIISIFGR